MYAEHPCIHVWLFTLGCLQGLCHCILRPVVVMCSWGVVHLQEGGVVLLQQQLSILAQGRVGSFNKHLHRYTSKSWVQVGAVLCAAAHGQAQYMLCAQRLAQVATAAVQPSFMVTGNKVLVSD